MVRDQDEISTAFSLWEQAKKDVADAEARLYQQRAANHRDLRALDILDAEIAVLRVRADRLLGQAIDALREETKRLKGGR